MNSQVGVKTAARALGVSPSTLKRLCDINIIPSVRTPGGHRRFERAVIDRVGRQILGEHGHAECPHIGQRWAETLRQCAQGELHALLDELWVSGRLFSQLDLIFRHSNEVLCELVQQHSESDYRIALTSQTVLSAISWQTSRIRLSKSSCRRAIGFPASFVEEVPQANYCEISRFLSNQIGSALIGLSLRILDIDALNLSEPESPQSIVDVARQTGVSYVWLVFDEQDRASSLERTLDFLETELPDTTRLLVFAPQIGTRQSETIERPGYSATIADLLRGVWQDSSVFTTTNSTPWIASGRTRVARI